MNITMYKNKGFTLIELLVVIAIIGVLASVVLASLNDARSSGQDASVKASINNMRAQAELFYDGGNTYTGLCTSPEVVNASSSVNAAGGGLVCGTDGSAWQMSSSLPGGGAYCVDSTGKATTTVSAQASSDVACP